MNVGVNCNDMGLKYKYIKIHVNILSKKVFKFNSNDFWKQHKLSILYNEE